MNEDIVEIIAAEILKWFGKYIWWSVILLLKFNHENGQWHRARLCRHGLVKENKDKLYWSHLLCSRKIVLHDIMGSPVEHIHGSRASWEINKLSRASWEINKLSHYGTRSNLVSWEVPQDSVLCPELLVLYISDLAATTAYIQTKIVWRWHQLSTPHLHSWRSSNTPQWSKQFLYG